MQKGFETQIQEIIQEIKELILIPMHPCTDVESELIERERLISERIKQLQPPKPPTCGTCDYVSPVYSLNSDGEGRCIKSMSSYRCKKVTCLRLDSFGDEDPIGLPLSGFGCNSHSDYGVPDETK